MGARVYEQMLQLYPDERHQEKNKKGIGKANAKMEICLQFKLFIVNLI